MFTLPSGEQALAEQTQVMTNCSPSRIFFSRAKALVWERGARGEKNTYGNKKARKIRVRRPPTQKKTEVALDNFSFLWQGLKSFVL